MRGAPVFGGAHGVVCPRFGQDAPIPSGAQFAVDEHQIRIQPMSVFLKDALMTETPPPEEWLLTIIAIPHWTIALVLLITVVIFVIFNVQAGQPTSNPSDIQKRFGLITWKRREAHFIIGLLGCALAMLMGAFFLTSFQLIQEILATSNQDTIRHLAIALPAVAAASAGLIDDRFRNNPTSVTDDKCGYLQKYLTTS